MLKYSDLVIAAWEGRRLVGFGRVLTDRVYRAALYDIIIDPNYQGQGLGSIVVKKLLNHPLILNIPVFSLFTRDKQGFYKRLGFVTNKAKGLTGMILVRGGKVYQDK